jgi:hypothetical protein
VTITITIWAEEPVVSRYLSRDYSAKGVIRETGSADVVMKTDKPCVRPLVLLEEGSSIYAIKIISAARLTKFTRGIRFLLIYGEAEHLENFASQLISSYRNYEVISVNRDVRWKSEFSARYEADGVEYQAFQLERIPIAHRRKLLEVKLETLSFVTYTPGSPVRQEIEPLRRE